MATAVSNVPEVKPEHFAARQVDIPGTTDKDYANRFVVWYQPNARAKALPVRTAGLDGTILTYATVEEAEEGIPWSVNAVTACLIHRDKAATELEKKRAERGSVMPPSVGTLPPGAVQGGRATSVKPKAG